MTTNPPDDWEVLSGTWGTDFDRDTSPVEGGDYSVEFKATTPGSDPQLRWTEFEPVRPSILYQIEARVYLSAASASEIFRAKIEWYDESEVLQSTSTFASTASSSTGQWISIGGNVAADASARLAKIILEKDNTAFTAHVDSVSLRPLGPYWQLERSDNGQSISGSSATDCTYNTTFVQEVSHASGIITFDRPGAFMVSGAIEFDALTDATHAYLQLFFNGGKLVTFGEQDISTTITTGMCGSFPLVGVVPGDTCKLVAWHNDSVAQAVDTLFFGYRMGYE